MKVLSSPLAMVLVFLVTAACRTAPDRTVASEPPVMPAATASPKAEEHVLTPEQQRMKAELEALVAGRENEPAEKVFKNIQVFKGLPAGRLLGVMSQGFVPALGVQCAECHVPGKWESDEKHDKLVARKMVLMTRSINNQVKEASEESDAAVSCYTCHRGGTKPATSPGR